MYEPLRRQKMKAQKQPTSAELEILDILWDLGQATVREVFEHANAKRATTYTTILKFMQIMQEKGLVKRDERAKAHVYRPNASRGQVQNSLVGALMDRAFRGSALSLVQHALEAKPATREELDAIRRLIDDAEAKGETK